MPPMPFRNNRKTFQNVNMPLGQNAVQWFSKVWANSLWTCTAASLLTQCVFPIRKHQFRPFREDKQCFRVTFLTVQCRASCLLMMSRCVPLSCLLSPERWNVYGGICQNATKRAALLCFALLVQWLPVHSLVTKAGFIPPKWSECVNSSGSFCYSIL